MNGAYTSPLFTSDAFDAVPFVAFGLLWNDRKNSDRPPNDNNNDSTEGWKITIELIPDSTE